MFTQYSLCSYHRPTSFQTWALRLLHKSDLTTYLTPSSISLINCIALIFTSLLLSSCNAPSDIPQYAKFFDTFMSTSFFAVCFKNPVPSSLSGDFQLSFEDLVRMSALTRVQFSPLYSPNILPETLSEHRAL